MPNVAIVDDKKYLDLRPGGLYIVGGEWKYSWWPDEVETVIDLYNRGYGITIIARRVKSVPRDVFLLLIDLAEHNQIKRRPGFVWGAM